MTLTTTRPLPLPWQNSALRLPRVALHTQLITGMSDLDPIWVRLAPTWTNLGIFPHQFLYMLALVVK